MNARSKKPVIAVTGSGQGIGRAITLYFAERGYNSAVLDKNIDTAETVAEECKAFGVDSIAIFCDVTNRPGVEEAYTKLADYYDGRLDVQVNNAGVFRRERIEDATDEITDLLIDVNLKGTLNTSKAAIPLIKKTAETEGITGSIINAHSILGQFPDFGLGVYGAAKAGVFLLTRILAAECAPYGIRVNGYAPALTDTPMVHHVIEERWESKQDQIAMRQWGKPIQIAKICWFLATDMSEYTTGISVASDGGAWVVQRPFEAWKAAEKL